MDAEELSAIIDKKLSLVAKADDVDKLSKQFRDKMEQLEGKLLGKARARTKTTGEASKPRAIATPREIAPTTTPTTRETTATRDREVTALKAEIQSLWEQLNEVQAQQNDLEQRERLRNVRLRHVAEAPGETPDDVRACCCRIFTEMLGVETQPSDLEAAYRVGNPAAAVLSWRPGTRPRLRPRPILVRFLLRQLRDQVLARRKMLKGQGVWLSEDLTPANYSLERQAYLHSATLTTWTSHGTIFAKLKNNAVVKVKYGDEIEEVFSQAMAGVLHVWN